MQAHTIRKYVAFGFNFRMLQDAEEGTRVHGSMWIIEVAEYVFSLMEELHLTVTMRAGRPLRELLEEFKEKPDDYTLTNSDAARLRKAASDLRRTVMAEVEGNVAFIATDKRIDANRLLTGVRTLMSPGVFDRLPEIAKYDFSEAGKCIAFERSTAAAFHILRGTEAVLRAFYMKIVKRRRVSLLWGPIVDALKKRSRPKIPPVLLNNLDNIRQSFRNPTQHPEKTYDIEEVQDLFFLCVDVVNRMIALMPS